MNVVKSKGTAIIPVAWFKEEDEPVLSVVLEGETRLDKNVGALTRQVANDDIGRGDGLVHAVMDRKRTALLSTC